MSALRHKFKVILWKSYVLRKRHWLLSLFEVLAPLILFYLFTKYTPRGGESDQRYVVYDVQHLGDAISDYVNYNMETRQIAYTPDTQWTREIMNHLEIKLSQSALKNRFNITRFPSEDLLNKWLNTRDNYFDLHNIVAIVFSDDSTRSKLRYKIRTHQDTSAAVDELFSYRWEAENYFRNMFIIIQWILDSIFLAKVTGNGSQVEVALEQFPDEGYVRASVLNIFFPLITTFSFVFIMPAILKKVVEEKLTGIKELQRMMGLHSWMLWGGWMLHSLMVYGVSLVLITVMFRYHWADRTSLLYQVDNWIIILYLFFLFVVTMVLYCFAVSAFFTSPNMAMIVGILLWIIPPFCLMESLASTLPASHTGQLASCLSPPTCLSWAFSIFVNFQHKGKIWSWSMFFEKGTTGGLSMAHIVFMFYFDWLLFAFITWYVDAVKPGPFGRAKPFYFIFQLWRNKAEINETSDSHEQNNFELSPKDVKVGISIKNLRKVFGSKVAVDEVNLDICEGEITALLGHNGAGKTTTMSILTGLYSPSKGTVVVDGRNIFDDMDQFRQKLGLCPQHNLLFSYLTVIEHLIFFGMLKGLPKDRAEAVGLKFLVSFHMINKSDQFVGKLSGGMKRKLSLAIALMGDPKVLMLDEPTSGMDPESRREVWDVLLNYRGARTILITTHFMEEADVLGDRIAIMDHGRVSCYGTSIFLKKLYGTGYHIAISKEANKSEVAITSVIEDHLEGPKLKTNLPTQLSYNVASSDAPKFSSLFQVLESRKRDLGITGISIACTTMEDVFLRVAEGGLPLDVKAIPAEILLKSGSSVNTKLRVEGPHLVVQQLKALFIKKMLFLYRTWLSTLIFGLTPLLAISLVLSGGSWTEDAASEDSAELNLQMYGETVVSYTMNDASDLIGVFQDIVNTQGSSTEQFFTNINKELIAKEEEDNSFLRKAVVGVEFNRTIVTGLYNTLALHSAPIALNLVSNTLLRAFNPSSSIVVTSHPFLGRAHKKRECDVGQGVIGENQALLKALPWVVLACGLMIAVGRCVSLPLTERASSAKQLQLMTGVSPLVYWLAHFLWDFLAYLVALTLVMAAVWRLDTDHTFTASGKMGLLFFLLLFYGISGIPFAYLMTFLTRSSAKAMSLFLMFNLLTGIIASLISLTREIIYRAVGMPASAYFELVNGLLCLNPLYAETAALLRLLTVMVIEGSCRKCSAVCDTINPLEKKTDSNFWSILEYVIFLMTEWIFFWVMILLIEYGLFKNLWAKIVSVWNGPMFRYTVVDDDDVLEEKEKVKTFSNINSSRDNQKRPILKVIELGKKYSRKSTAVHGVSFLVERGQCFGLLGVNGAGKTTTFKMLTGEEVPTIGTASILDFDLVDNKSKYLQEIGYCPQFDALIELLTGEEMLQLYAALRGTPLYMVDSEVNNWINFIGLTEFAKVQCGTYSGGNKRKLSTVMALIGDPPVVCLDEPTAGVDPVSRRKLWDVLARCQQAGQAILLTSHSMEECEALCSRLTILVEGHMKCIGTTLHLKQRFGQGYTVMIKLAPGAAASCSDPDSALLSLKSQVNQTFSNCFIKDEHKGLLHYHLADNNVLLSTLFSKLEELRQAHSIIEDYTVGDTTLEQVFMSFAKQVPPTIVIEPVDV